MSYEITYTKKGDYYIPNLTLFKSKYSDYKLSKYGRMRARYLKEHKKAEYTISFFIIIIFNLMLLTKLISD